MISQPDISTRLATDTKGLDQLKNAAKQNAPESVKAVAQQFESMFMNMVMKSMREASGGEGGLLDNQQSKMFTTMLDQQLSQNMAKKGVGLADVLIRQLSPAAPQAPFDPSKPATGKLNNAANAVGAVNMPAAKIADGELANRDRTQLRGRMESPARASAANAASAAVPSNLNTIAKQRSDTFADHLKTSNSPKSPSTAGMIASLGKNIGGLDLSSSTDVHSAFEIGAGISEGSHLDGLDDFAKWMGIGGPGLNQLRAAANKGNLAAGEVNQAKAISNDDLKPLANDRIVGASARRQPKAVEMSDVARTGRSQPHHVRRFQEKLASQAEEASRTTGIPAKFLLGQAALESGWGKREIIGRDGNASHNLFGIKATSGWKGKVVEAVTTEYVNGVPQTRREKFRAYDSYADAFRDYARLLSKNPRYENVIANAQDAGSFARGLQRAGYATDPNYAAKLTRIITHSLS